MESKNVKLTVLKAIGIIAVVSCHVGVNIFNIIGIPVSSSAELFPEYSYHIPLFVFASGYFYKRIYEKNTLSFVKKRFSSIKKYMSSNLFYMILSFILISTGLLSRDIEYTFKSFFIEPFLGGFQFYFNGPGWFIPFLFSTQILYTFLRKVLMYMIKSFKEQLETTKKQEVSLLVFLIIVGVLSTMISRAYPVVGESVNITHSVLRVLFAMQFFQMGYVYKRFIEDKVKFSLLSLFMLIIVKVAVIGIFGNYTFSLRTLKFDEGIFSPVVVSILGIIYCLHLSEFIIKLLLKTNSKLLSFVISIGNNTWSIMMHHLLVKWSLNKIYNMYEISGTLKVCLNYMITPILCIVLPLVFSIMWSFIMNECKVNRNDKLQLNK